MTKGGLDLDAELDHLYAAPPSEFTSARNALVKTLEAAGRKEDAARVKALKKPNTVAWGVNQLALSSPRLLAALVASGDRMRAGGSDPKEAMKKRRDAVDEARREVERAFRGAGLTANLDVLRRISTTLEAIATYGSAPGGPAAGRLVEDVPAPGFDEIASLGLLGSGSAALSPAAATAHATESPKAPAAPSDKTAKRDADGERTREEKRELERREEARKELAERTKEAQRAHTALQAAEKAVEAIRGKRASLEAALSEVVAEEKALEAEHARAREASEEADDAEQQARRRSG